MEGKKESLSETEKGNVMEWKETFGGEEEEKVSSGGIGEFGGDGKGKLGDGEEVELGRGEGG